MGETAQRRVLLVACYCGIGRDMPMPTLQGQVTPPPKGGVDNLPLHLRMLERKLLSHADAHYRWHWQPRCTGWPVAKSGTGANE